MSSAQRLISKYRISAKDTGSSSVQVIQLTEQIQYLTQHVTQHPKDVHSRYGLRQKVNARRKLLKYMARKNHSMYKTLIAELGIRESQSK